MTPCQAHGGSGAAVQEDIEMDGMQAESTICWVRCVCSMLFSWSKSCEWPLHEDEDEFIVTQPCMPA